MRRVLVPGLLFTLACLASPRPAHAQLGALALGIAAGITAPAGGVSGNFRCGYHLEGLADLTLPLVPIGFRGRLAYDQMNAVSSPTPRGPLKLASGILDATFSLPFPVFHPYAIGGLGYYVHDSGAGTGPREGKAGLDAGVGLELKLPVIRAFGEARYSSIRFPGGHVGIVPVTVGIVF